MDAFAVMSGTNESRSTEIVYWFQFAPEGSVSRKLYIHAGPAKTATSAVQYALRDHDDSIVLYPKTGRWDTGGHHDLILNFAGDLSHRFTRPIDTDAMFASLAAEVGRTTRPVFVSSEMLSARDEGVDCIRALCASLPRDLDVEILFTIREHVELAASTYSQRLKDDRVMETRRPDEFLVQLAVTACYAPTLLRLLETGFRVQLFSYHPAADFVPRLLGHVGFPDDRIPAPAIRNPSLAMKAMVGHLAVNRVVTDGRARLRYMRALARMTETGPSRRHIFGQEALAAAERKFRLDRAFLFDKFGFDLPKRDYAGMQSSFGIRAEEVEEIADAIACGEERDALCASLREFVLPGT